MKEIVVVVGLLFTCVACGSVKSVPTVGVANASDAARLAMSTNSKVSQAASDSKAGPARDISISANVNYTCVTSGSLSINASVDATGLLSGAGGGSVDEKVTAKDCLKTDAYEIDGSLDLKGNFGAAQSSGDTLSLSLNGTVAIVVYNADGSVDQSGDVTYNNFTLDMTLSTSSTSGTPCTSLTVTTSGSVVVGGKTYAPNTSDIIGAYSKSQSGSFTACR